MLDKRKGYFLLYGCLYFAQGVILSYFLTFNVLYLREHGFGATEIGAFQAVLVLPFVLKILIGVVSDRVSLLGLGHRSPYIVLGLAVQIAAFVALPSIVLPGQLPLFFAVALTAAVGMALYDTGTDGLAVERTPARDRGLVQGIMVSARASGLLCALLGGSWLVSDMGWPAVFYFVALLSLPALVLALLLWERGMRSQQTAFDWTAFHALGSRPVLALAGFGLTYAFALDGVLSYLSYHPDSGGVGDIGQLGGLVALSMLGRIGGALFHPVVSRRLDFAGTTRMAIALSAFSCLGLSLQTGVAGLAVICLIFGFAYGYVTALYASTAMALSDTRIAASMFAIFMMFLNIGIAIGQFTGGLVVGAVGFQALAFMMALLLVPVFLSVRGLGRILHGQP